MRELIQQGSIIYSFTVYKCMWLSAVCTPWAAHMVPSWVGQIWFLSYRAVVKNES